MSNLDQRTVSEVLTLVPGVARTLREYRIDPSNRLLFSHAAAAASTTVEEVLAVAEMRQRRAAQSLRERAVHEFA